MEIPTRDTPALALLERGLGGETADARAVADCMQLLRVCKQLLGFFLEEFTRQSISPGKYSVLCELLAEQAPVSPSRLAERLGVSRPTVTGIVDGLCRQGLTDRSFDGEDRRRIAVTLTPQGERFIRALLPEQYGIMAKVLGPLSDAERGQLRGILSKLEGQFR